MPLNVLPALPPSNPTGLGSGWRGSSRYKCAWKLEFMAVFFSVHIGQPYPYLCCHHPQHGHWATTAIQPARRAAPSALPASPCSSHLSEAQDPTVAGQGQRGTPPPCRAGGWGDVFSEELQGRCWGLPGHLPLLPQDSRVQRSRCASHRRLTTHCAASTFTDGACARPRRPIPSAHVICPRPPP